MISLPRYFAVICTSLLSTAAWGADATPSPGPGAIRIACVGDTITRMSQYPQMLGQYLATDKKIYDVRNFGVDDSTVVATEKSWIKTPKAADALTFLPQIVVIEIGTQDTQKGKNWNVISTFPTEYKNIISQFAALSSKPKIYLCLPPPIYGNTGWGMSEENLTSTVIPNIQQVAKELNLPVIDLHTALSNHPELFHNSVHPVGDAKKYIAAAVYAGLFGAPPPGAPLPAASVTPAKNTTGGQ